MSLNPRTWGRVPQAALLVLLAVRLPSLVATDSTAALVGSLLGAVVGAIVVVGAVRYGVQKLSGGGDEPDASAQQNSTAT